MAMDLWVMGRPSSSGLSSMWYSPTMASRVSLQSASLGHSGQSFPAYESCLYQTTTPSSYV